MKRKSAFSGRFALTAVALATLAVSAPTAWSLGLGKVQVQSSLGESLSAEIDVTSMTPEEAANLRVRVAPPEAYKSSGIDYNAVLPSTQVQLLRHADGRPYLKLTSSRGVQEPFIDVILELNWATGRLVREYTMLFDPPRTARAPAPAPASASIALAAAAPVPAPAAPRTPAERRAQAGRISPETVRAARESVRRANAGSAAGSTAVSTAAPTTSAAGTSAPSAPSATSSQADQYRVRSGDNLSKVASKTLRPGVSLDQMLVSLYRGNPQAFIDNNMNLLRAGSVLAVPSAAAVGNVQQADAQQLIKAQSADFNAYRERLAGGVQATPAEGPSRQASGKVQAQVNDQKQAAAAAPDKLTLSQGGGAAASAGPDAQISKEGAKKAADARVAELSKNVDELRQLSGAASSVAGGSSPASAVATAPRQAPAASGPTSLVPTIVAAAPAAPAAPSTREAAPAVAAAASVAAMPASETSTSMSAPAAVAMPPSAPARRAPRPAAPVAAEQPGLVGNLLEDNPAALGIGALVIALLAGFGIYRFVRRSRGDSGETSFLESRLQPDSFFGASGGQRIDTRDAGVTSSSMSYSLSQLDAIGDVDPVAEADVYLAYGRDLQAEEILKEAMRSTPERMAIRTKLLEVYAKRRDTKGFELLATQLFALTRGQGEDWAKAQEMGAQIDPENPLFQPGGAPLARRDDGGEIIEPLGASTMPQSILPSPSQFGRAHAGVSPMDSGLTDLDLDLDLDHQPPRAVMTSPSPLEATQAMSPIRPARDDNAMALDFSISQVPELPPRSAASAAEPTAFDLSDISLDLDMPAETSVPHSQFGHSESSGRDTGTDLVDDPMSRKLELADEFRQIGDTDGARDLLNEVVASSSGSVKSRAESMLADLG